MSDPVASPLLPAHPRSAEPAEPRAAGAGRVAMGRVCRAGACRVAAGACPRPGAVRGCSGPGWCRDGAGMVPRLLIALLRFFSRGFLRAGDAAPGPEALQVGTSGPPPRGVPRTSLPLGTLLFSTRVSIPNRVPSHSRPPSQRSPVPPGTLTDPRPPGNSDSPPLLPGTPDPRPLTPGIPDSPALLLGTPTPSTSPRTRDPQASSPPKAGHTIHLLSHPGPPSPLAPFPLAPGAGGVPVFMLWGGAGSRRCEG